MSSFVYRFRDSIGRSRGRFLPPFQVVRIGSCEMNPPMRFHDFRPEPGQLAGERDTFAGRAPRAKGPGGYPHLPKVLGFTGVEVAEGFKDPSGIGISCRGTNQQAASGWDSFGHSPNAL